jgi:hypothetical protein
MPNLLQASEVVLNPQQTRPAKMRVEYTLPAAASTLESVQSFLASHAQEISFPFPMEGLRLVHTVETPIRKVFRFDYTLDGIPVFGAQLIVQTDEKERARHIENYPGPTNVIAPPAGAKIFKADQVLKTATDSLGAFTKRLDTPPPSEVWFPTKQGLRRAYLVLIATATPPHDWQMILDAYTREILDKRDLIKEMPDGTGMVFDPNPVVSAHNNAFRDPTATIGTCGFAGTAQAIIDAQRVSLTLKDLTVAGGNYTLDGPYCRIHNFAAPASTIPVEATGNFNYTSNDDRFEAVMVYHHIDTFQRYLQSIGITNAHPAVIQCDPHDNSVNAAWFSPFDGGLHFSDSGACLPDRAEDADCMIHEYGHAIQNSQVPGWGSTTNPVTGRDEAGAMGEGFGDFLACVYFADHSGGYQREVFEDWVFGPAGLRRVDGTKVYPASWASEVHADGEIWSAALWNIFRAIGGDSLSAADREAARQAIFRSVIHSHPLLATNASMPDGAEAVMTTNAELAEYRGQHLMQMLDSFHDRGILPVDVNANLFIRDDVADPGTESYHSPTFWDSPDLWVRNHDDNGSTHEEPKAGQDNWFYARVSNRGSAAARAFVITFNVKLWLGTEFTYPNDFVSPSISAGVGFNLAAGASTIVKARWPAALVPSAGSHGCLLASAYTPREHVPAGTHVWDHGNLAQKNMIIAAASPGDTVSFPFRFGNRGSLAHNVFRLEVRKSMPDLGVSLVAAPRILQALSSDPIPVLRDPQPIRVGPSISVVEPARLDLLHPQSDVPVSLTLERGSSISLGGPLLPVPSTADAFLKRNFEPVLDASHNLTELRFQPGRVVGLPILLKPRTDLALNLKVGVPKNARSGESYVVDVVQRNAQGQTMGGVRLKVVVQ